MFSSVRALLMGALLLMSALCLAPATAQAQTLTAVGALPGNPGNMAAIGTDVLVVEANGTRVFRVTPAGVVTTFATLGAGIFQRGLTLGHDGAYYATVNNGTVVRIDNTTGNITTLVTGLGYSPMHIVYNPTAGAYFITTQLANIYRMTTGGVSTLHVNVPGGQLEGIVIDAAGNLYSNDISNGNVYRIPSTAGPTATLVGTATSAGGGAYYGLARAANGDFYLPKYGNTVITRLTAGGVSSTFSTGVPNRLEFASYVNGVLYVADTNTDTVYRVELAPNPVPTLSEWAMILLGLMLAGGAAVMVQRRGMAALPVQG